MSLGFLLSLSFTHTITVLTFYHNVSLSLSLLSCYSHRLLFLEEHHDRLLVHAVPLWDVHQIRQRAGSPADHDPRQPQGGTGLWVCLQHARLWCQKADPLHCVHANQRHVLHILKGIRSLSLFFFFRCYSFSVCVFYFLLTWSVLWCLGVDVFTFFLQFWNV